MRRLQLRADFAGMPLGQALGQGEYRARIHPLFNNKSDWVGVVVTLRCGMWRCDPARAWSTSSGVFRIRGGTPIGESLQPLPRPRPT